VVAITWTDGKQISYKWGKEGEFRGDIVDSSGKEEYAS